MKIALPTLTRIRDQLVAHESALRVMYVELHQPGAFDRYLEAMAARIDFDTQLLGGTVDVDIGSPA